MIDAVKAASVFSRQDIKQSDLFAVQQQILGRYIPELDGLRALAIIFVVWHNVTAGRYTGGVIAKTINMLANSGWVGVQLFFVLSGFLITGILLDEKKTRYQLRNFYMRRFLRIFPLYYTVLCVAFLILPMLSAIPSWLVADRQQQIWYWTFLINWSAPFLGNGPALGHFWSLAVEEQFYLLWPLLVITLQRRSLAWVCVFLMVSALLTRGVLVFYNLSFAMTAAYKFTVARWDALAVGALLAILVRDQGWYHKVVRSFSFIMVCASIYIVVFMLLDRNFAPIGPGVAVFNQTATALLFGALLFSAIQADTKHSSRWQNFLACPPLRSIGKYSYAIYVFHLPLIQILHVFLTKYSSQQSPILGATGFALLVFSAAYVMAFCSWILLERPCLRMKQFFVTKKRLAS